MIDFAQNVTEKGMSHMKSTDATIELNGASEHSIDDAVQDALSKASTTIDWYEIIETTSTSNTDNQTFFVTVKAKATESIA